MSNKIGTVNIGGKSFNVDNIKAGGYTEAKLRAIWITGPKKAIEAAAKAEKPTAGMIQPFTEERFENVIKVLREYGAIKGKEKEKDGAE